MNNRKVIVDVAAAPMQAPARRRTAQTTDLGNNGPYGGINRMDVVQRIADASLTAGPQRAVAETVAIELREVQIAATPVRLTTTHGQAYACVYRAPDTDRWNVVENGRVYNTQAPTVQGALAFVHPWLWSYQELVDDAVPGVSGDDG
jgi:hypothetical protein